MIYCAHVLHPHPFRLGGRRLGPATQRQLGTEPFRLPGRLQRRETHRTLGRQGLRCCHGRWRRWIGLMMVNMGH